MQIVKTDKGYISGTMIGEPGKEISIFRGIPYAAPPVGDLRWKPPRPAAPWKGIRECTQFSAISPQMNMPGMSPTFPMSEDCLYLNVLTPARQPDEKLPVMVWMHGGGYSMGSGNDLIWNNYRLPRHDMVLVNLNHRLGPLGLCVHPALTKESSNGASGNYLFLDIIASLEWVRDNIAAFGGDPDNVTIFGESGGGGKVNIMMTSPLARGLFHRAIYESGTATVIFTGRSVSEMEDTGKTLFEKLGISAAGDPLEQARNIPFQKIIEVGQSMETLLNSTPVPVWDATVDGHVLPDSPARRLATDSRNAVPTIVSANLGELTGPGMLIIPQLIPAYIDILESVNRAGMNSYACIFNQVPSGWKREGYVSFHSIELPYVFGDWDNSTGWWNSTSMLTQQSGAEVPDPSLDKTDRTVSETMMELWTSFARTGKPRAKGVPDWPAFTASNDSYLYIGETPEVKTGFSKIPG